MNVILEINIFTKLALWADSVCYPPCMSVCLFVFPSVKNPADGRHRISRPMRIVLAPILFFRSFYSGDCRFWTSSHQGERVLMAVRNTFSLQVMNLFSVLIKETVRRLNVMVQVMSLFSVLIKDTIRRL